MAAYSTKMAFSDYSLLLVKISVAAFFMRSAACTVNDIFDRKFDASVGEEAFVIPNIFSLHYLQKEPKIGPLRLEECRCLAQSSSC